MFKGVHSFYPNPVAEKLVLVLLLHPAEVHHGFLLVLLAPVLQVEDLKV